MNWPDYSPDANHPCFCDLSLGGMAVVLREKTNLEIGFSDPTSKACGPWLGDDGHVQVRPALGKIRASVGICSLSVMGGHLP